MGPGCPSSNIHRIAFGDLVMIDAPDRGTTITT
jgi:hypothetical protein